MSATTLLRTGMQAARGPTARNLLWVFASNFLPLLAGIVTIPYMIRDFGLELFGLLTIIWMFVGYLSLFDFGVGRALTYRISSDLAAADAPGAKTRLQESYATGMALVGALSLVASTGFFFAAPLLGRQVLQFSPDVELIGVQALQVSALSVLVTVIATGLRGVLEGFGAFGIVSAWRIPLGIWMFVGPLLFFWASGSFVFAVAGIGFGRLVLCIVYWLACRRRVRATRAQVKPAVARGLLDFGGWLTVSNVVSPLITYFDRVLIGAYLSVSAVAYYTTPYEIVSKIMLVPASIGAVIFPRFAQMETAGDTAGLRRLTLFSYATNFCLTAPAIVILALFGERLLGLWINPDFAAKSAYVGTILSVGVTINAMASVPMNRLQALGESRTTALIHLVEAPLYLVALVSVLSSQRPSLEHVAMLWVARVTLDWLLLEWAVRRTRHG